MKRFLYLLIILSVSASDLWATHNRAGEITLNQIDELTYEIHITTFTYTLSAADRPRLEVMWGDNTYSYADRKSITRLPNFYQKNVYISQHTFPGPGTYEIVVQDPNRNQGVKNIPNSVNVVFSIKTTITINPVIGQNSTPVLLNPPIDRAAWRQPFIHNPAAYDPDGDSISYKLTTCTAEDGKPIEGYTLPPASDTLFIDPRTGDLTWISPVDTGIYNIAIDVEEYRKGVKIGNIVRDMQIEVYNTDNHAPVQTLEGDLCVQAGTLISFDVIATDADLDSIHQTASGGPFIVDHSPAGFTVDQSSRDLGYSKASFSWQTNCYHVRQQYYTVIFKAEDNNDDTKLVDLRNINIKVLGTPPPPPLLIPGSSSVTLVWEPDTCLAVSGYQVYRKSNLSGYTPDSCQGGVPAETGYILVGKLSSRTDTLFTDDAKGKGLEQGMEYCYMLVSVYPDGALSFPTPEQCTPLVAGTPSILQVSVGQQGSAGRIDLAWSTSADLDTVPGPYRYQIYRSDDYLGKNLQQIALKPVADLSDTLYSDEGLNTDLFPYSYRVELYHQVAGSWEIIRDAETASSLVPVLRGEDQQIVINMEKNVPWINYDYTVYRFNNQSAVFDSIGFTTTPFYTDTRLKNGTEYCYKVISHGWRILDDMLIENSNTSHVNCTAPIDTFPPCPPQFNGFSFCDSSYNKLTWKYSTDTCSEDVIGYRLYYSQTLDGTSDMIASFSQRSDSLYFHYPAESLTGCYYITAIDSFANESVPSVRICLDECSNYALPNVFSPNNDGINDLYKSFKKAYIDRVNMKIYNRWGLLVFETEDPDINWDGKILNTNDVVSPGIYYYFCDVFEYRLSGLVEYNLSGFIYVYSGKTNDVIIEK
ncbi:MAG: gliding motility-associated C-terminal domain-containing protein [Bacteroidota bacterium]